MYNRETCLMLLERYNGLIHENRFKRNIPENVWDEIEVILLGLAKSQLMLRFPCVYDIYLQKSFTDFFFIAYI